MNDLFLREKPVKVLLCLKKSEMEWYLQKLSKEAGITYVYLLKIIPKLKELNLIEINKKGKKQIITLTEKGTELASLLDDVVKKQHDQTSERKEEQ